LQPSFNSEKQRNPGWKMNFSCRKTIFQAKHDLVRRFAAIRRCRIQNLQSNFSRIRY